MNSPSRYLASYVFDKVWSDGLTCTESRLKCTDGSVTISGTVYVMGMGKELGVKAYNQPVTTQKYATLLINCTFIVDSVVKIIPKV